MDGFTFDGVHSSTVGLYLHKPIRTIKPPTRLNEYEIAGRDGTVDFGHEQYGKMSIAADVAYIATSNYALRIAARNIAMFLSGTGDLIFDDEPDKHFRGAKIVDAPPIEKITKANFVSLVWEVQPFSQAVLQGQSVNLGVDIPLTLEIESNGTIRCPVKLRIINRGTEPITELIITRSAAQT